ncbi:MAG: hypothetical protein NC395_07190 [Prevotella sp.]|nr:hypothetical protein [Prevotella sp.]
MENIKDTLRELLLSVCDSYDDFVHGVCLAAKSEDVILGLIDFMKDNPNADSSDVSFKLDELLKIPKWNAEKEVFE